MLVYREKQRGYGMMNESEVKRQLELLDLMNQAELREKFCDLFGFGTFAILTEVSSV